MTEFVNKLRSETFDALDVSDHIVDLQGWINPGFEECLARVKTHLNSRSPGTFIEIGSWKGASSARIATELRDVCRDVICIDTWLGAPEFYTFGLDDPTRGVALDRRHGYPTVFYTFAKNMKALGLHDIVTPFPMSSAQAVKILEYHGIRASAMYIDGAHEYEAVLADLEAYHTILRPGGVMWGDDYMSCWPGVVRAVDEFAAAKGVRVHVVGANWILNDFERENS